MARELPKVGGVGIQAEDEIASIGMCIGATMAGGLATGLEPEDRRADAELAINQRLAAAG